jgi:hypothetical protein
MSIHGDGVAKQTQNSAKHAASCCTFLHLYVVRSRLVHLYGLPSCALRCAMGPKPPRTYKSTRVQEYTEFPASRMASDPEASIAPLDECTSGHSYTLASKHGCGSRPPVIRPSMYGWTFVRSLDNLCTFVDLYSSPAEPFTPTSLGDQTGAGQLDAKFVMCHPAQQFGCGCTWTDAIRSGKLQREKVRQVILQYVCR